MTTEIKIKEHDLHAIIKDLVDSSLKVNRPNKGKICKFIVNLVDNGGNKTKAAIDAGFGAEKGKDGKERTINERKCVASTEADRLLNNAEILAVYEKLLSHRFMANIFTQSFSREHVINILYQIAIMTHEKNPRQAVMALKEASTLAGHYEIAEKSAPILTHDQQEELTHVRRFLGRFDSRKEDQENVTPKPIISEVYN